MNALIALSTLVSVCLAAQPTIDPATLAHALFVDADTDGDGILHRAELVAVFSIYDANGDGRVSRHEYTSYQTAHDPALADLAHFLYDTYDVNNDHHLEAQDYDSFYRLMDTDGDDSVTESEFTNYWTVLLQSVAHHIPGK